MSQQNRHRFRVAGSLETLDSRITPAVMTFLSIGPRFPVQHAFLVPRPNFTLPPLVRMLRANAIQLTPRVTASLAARNFSTLATRLLVPGTNGFLNLVNVPGLGSAVMFRGRILVPSSTFPSSLRPFLPGFGPTPLTSAQLPFLMLGNNGLANTAIPGTFGTLGTTNTVPTTGFGLGVSPLVAGSLFPTTTTTTLGMPMPGVLNPLL